MARDRASLHAEALYLRELNEGLQRLLGHLGDVAQELARVPIAVLELVQAPPTPESVASVTSHALTALEHVALTQRCTIELGDLLGARLLTFQGEAGDLARPDA